MSDTGVFKIKCVKVGGITLTNYGQQSFSENEELDLLDAETPAALRAGSYSTADTMCRDPARELAQRIAAGEFIITERAVPDMRSLRRQ